jgi:tetratricopeptide (TPR) repeat protein
MALGERQSLAPGGLLMSRYRAEVVACLLLALLTVCALGSVSGHDFVNYDDPDYVTENPQVQAGLTRDGVAWAFSTTRAANWHPLTWLSLELDQQLYGPQPAGFHRTNLILHVVNTLLLFLCLRRMTGLVGRSAVVAALFAVHPLHVESVAWVSERKDVLSTLFWMLTLLAYAWYVERPGWRRYLPVLAAFALGLMAKPMLVTLPCVLLLLDYWPLRRFDKPAPSASEGQPPSLALGAGVAKLVLEKLPLFALSAASCAMTLVAQRRALSSFGQIPLPLRLVNALMSYAEYVGKTFYPLRLAVLYPYPSSWPWWELIAGGLLLVAVTALALRTARRRPYILVGWLWYLGTLVPVIGLVQVGKQQMADRYTYVPLIGLFLILVWGVGDVLARRPGGKAVAAVLTALALLACVVLSWRQAGTWRDTESLWTNALVVTTANADACINVGAIRDKQGKTAEAVALYRKALEYAPDDPVAHYHLGGALARQGKEAEAAPHLKAALRLDPRQSRAHLIGRGEVLMHLGQLDEAQKMYEAALRDNPDDAMLHVNLGSICFKRGDLDAAGRHFGAALKIDPTLTQAHNNLGSVLLQQGQVGAAAEHFAAALRSDPRNAVAHCNLGEALARLGKNDEAAAEYREALRLQPNNARAQRGLEGTGAADAPRSPGHSGSGQ